MKFCATVKVMVPCHMDAEVEVEAASRADADRILREMYDNDQIDFGDAEKDYDEAKIVDIIFGDGN